MEQVTRERVMDIVNRCLEPLTGIELRNPVGTTVIAQGLVPQGTKLNASGADAYKHVPRTELIKVLDELVADGMLVKKTGAEWKEFLQGSGWWGLTPRAAYYATPAVTAELRKFYEEQDRGRRLYSAKHQAAQILAQRHPEEFDQIVAELMTGDQK